MVPSPPDYIIIGSYFPYAFRYTYFTNATVETHITVVGGNAIDVVVVVVVVTGNTILVAVAVFAAAGNVVM